jgi:GT2 family glycosyltransferase
VFLYTQGCTYEVLLLDCSNDGSVQLVEAEYPAVRIIENSENLGFGRGNNTLAEHAHGKFLLLLNPDVIVTDNAIGEIYRTAVAMPHAGAVGGWTKLPDGKRDPGCRQTIPTVWRLLIAAFGGAKYLNGALPETAKEAAEVETLTGAFMLVNADAWRKVDGFDTSFFMYSEELDLCQRLRQQGWAIVMTPRAEVIHLVGGGNGQSPQRIKLIATARMHYFRKFWSRPRVLMGGAVLWFHGLIRVIGGTIGGLVLRRDRAKKLRDGYSGIVFQPWTWWYGFTSRADK